MSIFGVNKTMQKYNVTYYSELYNLYNIHTILDRSTANKISKYL
jgi:hypothetical protein